MSTFWSYLRYNFKDVHVSNLKEFEERISWHRLFSHLFVLHYFQFSERTPTKTQAHALVAEVKI